MSGKRDLFTAVWFTDYLGIGYIYDGRDWSVFPVFKTREEAEKVWMEFIEPLSEGNLRIRFIEYGEAYKFILYPYPLSAVQTNFGFYRSLDSSETYRVFKSKFNGQALFRFGVIEDGKPTMMRRSKLVTDVKFMKSSEVKKNSFEWIAEEVQRKAREDTKKEKERDKGLVV